MYGSGMRVCLMIEGQEGVTWDEWVALARACEEHGLDALFRSDHYLSFGNEGVDGSHDAWATINALAMVTERIRLGTLVSPATFRHPSNLANLATTADHVSGGRVELGMGAGWFRREHDAFGFPFPDDATRMRMLAEQLAIVHGLWTEDRFSFGGEHFTLDDVPALPKPVQRPHPPLIMGGSAGPKSVRLAARFADEYNSHSVDPAELRLRKTRVEQAFEAEGRDPASVRYSVMTRVLVGADEAEYAAKARAEGMDPDQERARHGETWFGGTADEVVERLHRFAEAGCDGVMLQHIAHRDLEMVALIGREIAPRVR